MLGLVTFETFETPFGIVLRDPFTLPAAAVHSISLGKEEESEKPMGVVYVRICIHCKYFVNHKPFRICLPYTHGVDTSCMGQNHTWRSNRTRTKNMQIASFFQRNNEFAKNDLEISTEKKTKNGICSAFTYKSYTVAMSQCSWQPHAHTHTIRARRNVTWLTQFSLALKLCRAA